MNTLSSAVKLLAAASIAAMAAATTAAADPVQGGTLIIAQDESPDRIDPHFALTVQHRLIISGPYESLLAINNDFALEPSLATEWVQESPIAYVFTLRDGVKFHDGSPLTVDDVLYTFERIMDPNKPSSSQNRLRMIKAVTADGDKKVRFELKGPSAPFLRYMADPTVAGIVSRKFTTAHNSDLATIANGTGPFKITRYQSGVGIRMEKFADYWMKDLPYLDAIDIQIIPDDSTRLAAIRTGEIDMALFRPDKARLISTLKDVTTSPLDTINAPEFLILNCKVAPFDKKEVRQAFALSIDRAAIASTVMGGGLAKPGMWVTAADKIYGYQGDGSDIPLATTDVEQAKKLLASAGLENGVDIEVQYISSPAFQINNRISEMVKQQAEQTGFNVTLKPVEYSAFLSNYAKGQFQVHSGGRGIEADPDSQFSAEMMSESPLSQCDDPKVDELIKAQQTELDPTERAGLIDQLQKYVSEEAYYVFLYNSPLRIELWSDEVKGYTSSPMLRRTALRETWLERK